MTTYLRNMGAKALFAAMLVAAAVFVVSAPSAEALGSGKFPWRGDDANAAAAALTRAAGW
jgi:hypothetical protein